MSKYDTPLFNAFLEDVFDYEGAQENLAQQVREFIGAALMGRSSELGHILLLSGRGANGKSALKSIIEHLFEGRTFYAQGSSLQECYDHIPSRNWHTHQLLSLEEMPEKAFTSWYKDPNAFVAMRARFEPEPIYFRPSWSLLCVANTVPCATKEPWGRILLVPMERRFTMEEQDRSIVQKVNTEREAVVLSCLHAAYKALDRGAYS